MATLSESDAAHQADAFLAWWAKEPVGDRSMEEAFEVWCDSKDFHDLDRQRIWAATEKYEPWPWAPAYDNVRLASGDDR